MQKCETHNQYRGGSKPRRTKLYPEGCPICWEVYHEVGRKAVEDARPRASKKSLAAAITRMPSLKGINGKKLKVEVEDTGEYALTYGRRCLYVAPTMDSVEAFLDGFREGIQYIHYERDEA